MCNQYKHLLMGYFTSVFFIEVCRILCVFYTHSASQLGLATFRAQERHVAGDCHIEQHRADPWL